VKRVLIVGGLGFIGYNLAKKLALKNFEVYCIDSVINYLPNNFSAWNYYNKFRQKELESLGVKINVENILNANFKQLYFSIKPDCLINFAAMPIALLADLNPANAKTDIFDSNFQLLEIIKSSAKDLSRYIYISSSMVYGNFLRDGNQHIIPANENQPCHPIDTYGAFKLANEILIKQYAYRYKIPYTIIRPSAVYGPTDCNLRVTEIFLKKAIKGETLELDNGGQHELDFTYIDDLTEGIYLSMLSEKAVNETFNFSCGQGRKIAELATVVKKYFPGIKIRNNESKPFRPNRGAMDISKAKTLLGYNPLFPLEKGIKQYLDFLQAHFNQYES
jgi:UDP-glucose 4-epimerase